jgi:hypothetical protein
MADIPPKAIDCTKLGLAPTGFTDMMARRTVSSSRRKLDELERATRAIKVMSIVNDSGLASSLNEEETTGG